MKSRVVASLIFVLAACGCGNSTVTRVSGTLLLDGQPVHGARVVFCLPDDDGFVSEPADGAGCFHFVSHPKQEPAFSAGSYAVIVHDPANRPVMMLGKKPEVPMLRTPRRYCFRETTPLRVELRAGDNEPAPLALTRE